MAVASLIPPGVRLCDVGTDHGFLPIKLVLEGYIPKAIAMDLRPGPLERALAHTEDYGLSDKIDVRLSDGLMAIDPGDADCVSISGMGGLNIQGILNARPDVVSDLKYMVLQPQSDIDVVRCLVIEKGFWITSEKAILEDGKYYFAMLCEKAADLNQAERSSDQVMSDSCSTKLSRSQALFGPCLIKNHDKILYSYLNKEKRTTEKIIDNLKSAEKTDRNTERSEKAEDYLSLINEVLQEF
jgi:tRNA (adenine22-N1)-methyltransferase